MHWHSLEASSVVLALISSGTLLMTQSHQYVCVCCEECTFTSAFPSVRAAKTHIGMYPACLAAGLGIKELALEIRQTDTMVSCSDEAGPAPDLRH